MDDRKNEIEFIVGTIHKLCMEYDIVLMPCETTKGTKYVGILDNTTGTTYAMIDND